MSTTTIPTTEVCTLEQINELMPSRDSWCVSLVLPTHRAGREIREDPIRLKNRLTEAERQLEQAGVDANDIRELCQPARKLCDLDTEANREFWRHQADGLVIFLAKNELHMFQLQVAPEELTLVAHTFYLRPLLRGVQRDQEYCLIAVSQNDVRFLEGTRSGLTARPVEDLPDGLQDVVRGEHHKGFNLHSFRVRTGEGDNAVPHGHVESDQQHELQRYCRTIAEAVAEELSIDAQRPLIFAGVPELFAVFKQECEYAGLGEQFVRGNPDDLSPQDLHEKAWPLVEDSFREHEDRMLSLWKSAAHTDLAETDMKQILVAATDGRVDTLFVDTRQQVWGTFDEASREASIEKEPNAMNYDLLDRAVAKTLQIDGRVAMLEKRTLPSELPAAAICRYAQ